MFGTWTRGGRGRFAVDAHRGPWCLGVGEHADAAVVSADGRWSPSACSPGLFELWGHGVAHEAVQVFRRRGHDHVRGISVPMACSRRASSDATICVWDTGTGALLRHAAGRSRCDCEGPARCPGPSRRRALADGNGEDLGHLLRHVAQDVSHPAASSTSRSRVTASGSRPRAVVATTRFGGLMVPRACRSSSARGQIGPTPHRGYRTNGTRSLRNGNRRRRALGPGGSEDCSFRIGGPSP